MSGAATARYRAKNKEKVNACARRCVWRALGISMTEREYQRRVKEQNGRCLICKRQPSKRFCVDHCHETNQVRGLLCRKCNLGLGHFDDSIWLLRKAIKYLLEA